MPPDQRGNIGPRLRRDAAGACQLQQLVDAIVEPGNLGQGLRRLTPRDGIGAVGDQLQADRDGGQRRTELMARVRAELPFGRHQLGNSLATVLERIGDRVDLHQPTARRDDAGFSGAELCRSASEAIERPAQVSRFEQRGQRGEDCYRDSDEADHVPCLTNSAIDRRLVGRHGRRQVARALALRWTSAWRPAPGRYGRRPRRPTTARPPRHLAVRGARHRPS